MSKKENEKSAETGRKDTGVNKNMSFIIIVRQKCKY